MWRAKSLSGVSLALSYLQREGMTMLSVYALEERASDKKLEETGALVIMK